MQLVILLQILLIWLIVFSVYNQLALRDGRAPIDDIGLWWLGAFLLYSTLPPLSWLIQGGSYGPLSGRLFKFQPTNHEVAYLLSISLAYVFGFTSVFHVLSKRVPNPVLVTQVPISNSKMVSAILIISFSFLIGILLVQFGLIRKAESYTDSYAVIYELPRSLAQLHKMLGVLTNFSTLVLVVAIFQSWPKFRILFLIHILVIILSIDPEGGRGRIVTAFLAIVVAWHVLIRPITSRKFFIGAFLGLVIFLVFGILRSINSLSEVGVLGFEGIGVGEFDALWANAIELLQAKKNGEININFQTRFGEIIFFIPSQLLWFEKLSLNDWYLNNFYPGLKETGNGWVFGAISQSVIGGGLIEAAIRGAILGLLAGWFMKWVRSPSKAWWRLPLHLMLLVGVFSSIRETTFIQFTSLIQVVLTAPVIISIIGLLITTKNQFRNPL
jgi:oligosaccharide repeat unit polymerase